MLRVLDLVLAGAGLLALSPLMIVLFVAALVDTGAPIFSQVRVGRYQRPFTLLKFRTMRQGTHSVPTHLVDPSAVTLLGSVLRRSKLDELPQLWNVLRGDMSLVGPRPCLSIQHALIAEREIRGVFAVRPGITGLAQVQGIDMSTPQTLAEADARMLENLDAAAYLGYLLQTLTGAGSGDRLRLP